MQHDCVEASTQPSKDKFLQKMIVVAIGKWRTANVDVIGSYDMSRDTYLVSCSLQVICEFEQGEGDAARHPRSARGRRIWMNVYLQEAMSIQINKEFSARWY